MIPSELGSFGLAFIVEGAGHQTRGAPAGNRPEEPQFIPHQRATNCGTDAVDTLNLAGGQTVVCKVRIAEDILTLHRRTRIFGVNRACEGITTLTGNRVQGGATRPVLGAHASDLKLQFTNRVTVGDVTNTGRTTDEILVAEAVEGRSRSIFAVVVLVLPLGRPRVTRATDICTGPLESRGNRGQRLEANVCRG